MKKKILVKDKKFLWHPFTQSKLSVNPIVIDSAKGENLYDIDGNEYIDLISSWWINTHGHCRKEIVEASFQQSKKLEQVLFAGFTHQPAVSLAEKLVKILPKNLSRVFYSDNGSTSVEIAMKVAIQYWYNKGKKRNKFVALTGGYHGDTFGAMSVGKTSGFYKPFENILNENFFIPFPDNWRGNNKIEQDEIRSLNKAKKLVKAERKKIAAVIIEPLVQGAGGMKICRKEYLTELINIFKESGIIVIFDEVMTGFGRTGKMFASDHLKVEPDIICLAKSLTGGFIPLAATIFSEEIHNEFVDDDLGKTFLHGHTFSANPVACSVALSSLHLFQKDKTFEKIKMISEIHKNCLNELSKNSQIFNIRMLGSIAAFNFSGISDVYGSKDSQILREKFLKNGLLLRPIGNTIYLMPPYCIKKKNLIKSYEKLNEILQ
ncbi:MAG: adenosylmethionine--8-amino-7-oxononanoate transaminase [Alphaproteobacteria bacterium]